MLRSICLPLAALWTLCAGAQNRLTIGEYRRAVVDYSHTLRIARTATLSAEQQSELSRTGMLPHLDASGRFAVDMRGHEGIEPFSFSLQPTVVQTVYAGGGVRAAYRRDRLGADAALCEEFFTMIEVVYAADYAYWNLAATIDALRVAHQYVDIIRSLKSVIVTRFDNGYISKSDVLMIETRLSEAEYRLVASEQRYETALHNFNILMGADATDCLPADSVMCYDSIPQRLDSQRILDRRTDYAASLLREEQADLGIRIARAEYMPRVSVGVAGLWQTRSPNRRWHTTLDGTAYLSLDVPIFHWGDRRHAENIARQTLAARREETAALRDRIIRDETDAWSAIGNSRSQTESSIRNLDIARRNLDLSTYSYSEGQLTILDVLSAQLSWLQVYENALEAALNYHLAIAEYRRVSASE